MITHINLAQRYKKTNIFQKTQYYLFHLFQTHDFSTKIIISYITIYQQVTHSY